VERVTESEGRVRAAQVEYDPARCTLTVPNDLAFLPMVQAFVRNYVSWLGFPPEEQARFDLLVEEEVTNVIEGAFAPGERAEFAVSCERVAGGVRLTVHDEGMPHDPSLVADYDPSADLDSRSETGLGSFLLRSFADEVEFHNLGSKGKQTVIVKYLAGESVADGSVWGPPVSLGPPKTVPVEGRAGIEIVPMKPEQAVEVARCIYDSYRYTYVNEQMYYPDRIAALNVSGDIYSAVAVALDGEVAGHAALVFSPEDPGVADLALAATKAKFRGQSIASRLGKFLDGEALARGLAGLFIEEVTVHTFTQRFCHKIGFIDCGFLLAYSPVTTFRGIDEDRRARGSVIIGFKYLSPPVPLRLYAPARQREVISQLYADMGVSVEMVPSPAEGISQEEPGRGEPLGRGESPRRREPLGRGEPVLMTTVNLRRAVATIRIPAYGEGLKAKLRRELHRVLREEVRVVVVFLDLLRPGTPWVADMLENMGFLFTGIRPGGGVSEWAVYEFFHGVIIDYDGIQVELESTRRLLDYIRRHDPHAADV
jgi:serine/threonine-protein kinase RsbW